MSLQQTLDVYQLFDQRDTSGESIKTLFSPFTAFGTEVSTIRVKEESNADFVRIIIKGINGKSVGGSAPTLGLIGRNGAIGARPARLGLVSDADGAIAVIATALKIAQMASWGDRLEGDVIVTTHISTDTSITPHDPVDFMGMPVSSATMNRHEVDSAMDAILSVDTSKGNEVINHRGFAITSTVKEGYVLRVSPDLLRIMKMTTGELPHVMAISTQDITDYDNGLYHINSIMQPNVATSAPVVGVPITAQSPVPGCGSGASHEVDIAEVVRFCTEVAIEFTDKTRYHCDFFNQDDFNKLLSLYGSMQVLQKPVI